MYPKNAVSPERIAVGAVVLIADGTVQTATVLITVTPQGGASAAGGGTTSYEQGVVLYLPTQAETNYSSFVVTAYKASCIPVAVTVVTSASATAGKVVLSGETHTSAVIPTVTTLTGHTAQTGDSFARLGVAGAGLTALGDTRIANLDAAVSSRSTYAGGAVASVTGAVGSVTGAVGSVAGAVGSVTGNVGGNVVGSVASVTAGVTLANGAHGGAAATASFGGAGGITSTLTGSLTGSVGSVTGAVGSVTGAVGSVTGAVGSVTAAVTLPSIPANWITAAGLAADAGAEIADAVWDEATAGHASAGTTGLALTSASAPSAATVADAVWDEVLSGHAGVGSAGAALSAAGTAGDPWITALPGAYAAGTAGYKIGNFNSLAGAGAITWPYTLTDSGTGLPIADADVWVTSDTAGLNVLASGRTNASGVVTFYLDAGTVYVWRQKSGYDFSNPDSETVV